MVSASVLRRRFRIFQSSGVFVQTSGQWSPHPPSANRPPHPRGTRHSSLRLVPIPSAFGCQSRTPVGIRRVRPRSREPSISFLISAVPQWLHFTCHNNRHPADALCRGIGNPFRNATDFKAPLSRAGAFKWQKNYHAPRDINTPPAK